MQILVAKTLGCGSFDWNGTNIATLQSCKSLVGVEIWYLFCFFRHKNNREQIVANNKEIEESRTAEEERSDGGRGGRQRRQKAGKGEASGTRDKRAARAGWGCEKRGGGEGAKRRGRESKGRAAGTVCCSVALSVVVGTAVR